jgi:hypothetical protein
MGVPETGGGPVGVSVSLVVQLDEKSKNEKLKSKSFALAAGRGSGDLGYCRPHWRNSHKQPLAFQFLLFGS